MIARQMVAANLGDRASNRSTLDVTVNTGVGTVDRRRNGVEQLGHRRRRTPARSTAAPSCFTVGRRGDLGDPDREPEPRLSPPELERRVHAAPARPAHVTVNGLTSVTATFYPDAPTVYVDDVSTFEGKAGNDPHHEVQRAADRAALDDDDR